MAKWVLLPLRGGRSGYVNFDAVFTIEPGPSAGQAKLWFGGVFLSELIVELSPERVVELSRSDSDA